jgi:hypothetical protein
LFSTPLQLPAAAGDYKWRAFAHGRLESRRLLAVITPFAPRFSANDTGDIAMVANTLMTAPDSDVDAANARNGVGARINDNDFTMVYVDVKLA